MSIAIKRIRCATVIAAAALLNPLFARAEDCEKPTSASDIMGNLKSFGCNVGKGVKIRNPGDPLPKIVAAGVLPGLASPPPGYDYNAVCYEGDKNPTAMQPRMSDGRNGVVGGTMTFSAAQMISCASLIESGTFHLIDGGVVGSRPPPTYNGKLTPDPCPDNQVMLFGGRAYCEDRHKQVSNDQAERIHGLMNAIQACRTMIRNGSQCPPGVVAKIKSAKIGKGLPTLDVTAY